MSFLTDLIAFSGSLNDNLYPAISYQTAEINVTVLLYLRYFHEKAKHIINMNAT